MNKILGLILAVLLVTNVVAQEKNLAALKINTPIKIDGILDEAVWQQAAIADSFIVNFPTFGIPAKQKTEVRVICINVYYYYGCSY